MRKMKEKKQEKSVMSQVFRECADVMLVPLLLTVTAEIVNGILRVATASILGEFTDAVFELNMEYGIRKVPVLAACVMATVFAAPLIGLIGAYFMLKKALAHDKIVLGHYLDKEPEKAMVSDTGKLQYQLEDASNTLRIRWVTICSKVLSLPVYVGYLLFCAGKVSISLTILMFLLAAVRLFIPALFNGKLASYDKKTREYRAKRRDYEEDVTRTPYSIRLHGIQEFVLERMHRLFSDYYNEIGKKQVSFQVLAERLGEFVNHMTQLLFIVSGAVLVAEKRVTPGELAMMLLYFTMVQEVWNHVADIIQNYPPMINAAKIVCEFYKNQEKPIGVEISQFSMIEGENICYSYSGKEVFAHLDFCVRAGDKIGICGENGCGKSTLIKILIALFDSYHGKLTVNQMDFRDLDKENWRKLVAYVPQNPPLFHATVRENIVMGDPDIDNIKLNELMKELSIVSDSERIITMDSGLSGGEKQKIAIARALLKKSEILILDEPTNHLDEEGRRVLEQYLSRTDKTVLLISHDVLLLNLMDRCICMQHL